jgi:hypothetical protein
VADGSKADWFFIPVRMRSSKDAFVLLEAMDYIKATWPWWNETHGARHFIFHVGELSNFTAVTRVILGNGGEERGMSLLRCWPMCRPKPDLEPYVLAMKAPVFCLKPTRVCSRPGLA